MWFDGILGGWPGYWVDGQEIGWMARILGGRPGHWVPSQVIWYMAMVLVNLRLQSLSQLHTTVTDLQFNVVSTGQKIVMLYILVQYT